MSKNNRVITVKVPPGVRVEVEKVPVGTDTSIVLPDLLNATVFVLQPGEAIKVVNIRSAHQDIQEGLRKIKQGRKIFTNEELYEDFKMTEPFDPLQSEEFLVPKDKIVDLAKRAPNQRKRTKCCPAPKKRYVMG